MSNESPAEFTPDEKVVIHALAKRQRESESLESRALSRYANSAALVNHVWVVGSAIFLSIVGATIYVVNQGNVVTQNQRDIASLRTQEATDIADVRRLLDTQGTQITDLRLKVENKEDRNDNRASHP